MVAECAMGYAKELRKMVIRGADYSRVDYDKYPTPREPVEALFRVLPLNYFRSDIYDPCMGDCSLLSAIPSGYNTFGSDITSSWPCDFLKVVYKPAQHCDIITNPPYGQKGKLALAFIERALELPAGRIAMLLPLDFDSAKTRTHVFRDCSVFHYKIILLNRIIWFPGPNAKPSANHAWFIWNKSWAGTPRLLYG